MNVDTIFQTIAAAILAAFFIIFFGKMAAQKRQGMRTGLLKRDGKSAPVFATELTLKVLVFAIYGVQIASIVLDTHVDILWLRISGAAVGTIGVVVFGIAVHTMADSWRTEIPEQEHHENENRYGGEHGNTNEHARTQLVTHGIFGIGRNPAFLGFDLMFAGVAAMFPNPVLIALTLCCIVMYHLQILREEKYLTTIFGTSYTQYTGRVRRYLGTKKQKR